MKITRLGNKILLAMVGVILTITASFLIYFVSYVGNLLEIRARNRGLMLVNNLARSSELGILTEEDRFLQGPFKGVLASSNIIYVMAYDSNGRLIKEKSKVKVDAAIPEGALIRAQEGVEPFFTAAEVEGVPDVMDYYAPVIMGGVEIEAAGDEDDVVIGEVHVVEKGELIGVVRIGMSGADIAEAKRRVVIFGIAVSFAVFLLSTGIVLLLARQIARPLVNLRESASRVARGDLDFQISVRTRDEVGVLAQSFNRMTQELQRTTFSRDYVNNILGSMVDTLVVIDDEGKISMVNRALLKLLGYEERELIGERFEKVLDDPAILNSDQWADFLSAGKLNDFELNYVTKNGDRIPMNFTGAIMVEGRRGTKSIVGVAHDMREMRSLMSDLERRRHETEQARYEADLERRRLMSLVSSLSEGVLMFDPDGEVVVANPFVRRLMRLPTAGKISRKMLQGVDWLKIDDLMKNIMATPSRSIYREVEVTFPVPQDIRIATSRVLTKDGRELGLVMVLHDVTEERQMDRMRDEFVATVSHDLRTPLTTIKGFVALLLGGKAGKLEEKQRQFLKHVEESSEHLHKMINDLLDLSRIRAGKLLMQIENVDLRELIIESIGMNAHAAESKKLNLTYEVPRSACTAEVDSERIKEVLNNLIGNAIKFTPEGGKIKVIILGDENSCMMGVSDTGVGISKEYQAIIFDKFRSVPQQGAETSLSTGLGLSIVKGIVEAHGGRVWVDSEPGKGSTFFVSIPRRHE